MDFAQKVLISCMAFQTILIIIMLIYVINLKRGILEQAEFFARNLQKLFNFIRGKNIRKIEKGKKL